VQETGRLVVVDEANPRCSLAADIASRVAQECWDDLEAAPQMVTAPHSPVPFSPILEDLYVPGADRIEEAVRATTGERAPA
jgi:pyruvate/2-oxoglutarate/acetoin dehydrogenase E1 component